jgi:NtrC-family two-component system response regulator AlgB
MKILLVGDEAKNRRLLAFGLATETDEPAAITSTAELMQLKTLRAFDVALIDWEMRGESAATLLSQLRRLAPCLPVVAGTTTAVRGAAAQAAGAVAALLKPLDIDIVRDVLKHHARTPVPAMPAAVPVPEPTPETVSEISLEEEALQTRSAVVQNLLAMAGRVAPTPATVLILGENGTGKTRLARMIHEQSARRDRPFVTVNCPCLQAQLLESELFGHVRGSFTGAVSDTIGKVAAAEGGTLFLDEVGELPLAVQPKLLRLLQDHCYERVGETRTRLADIRVLAATNRDLKAEMLAGRFREDLFYRLNVISLVMPPLRNRVEDIVPSAEHFLEEIGRSLGRHHRGFTLLAREALQRHPWPGNLRELRNTIERVAILVDRELIDVGDLSELQGAAVESGPQVGDFVTLEALQEAHIRRVIERAENYGHAARVLGIDKATLYRHRKRTENRVMAFDAGLDLASGG